VAREAQHVLGDVVQSELVGDRRRASGPRIQIQVEHLGELLCLGPELRVDGGRSNGSAWMESALDSMVAPVIAVVRVAL